MAQVILPCFIWGVGVCGCVWGECIFLVIKPSVLANKFEETVLLTDFFSLLCNKKKWSEI